MGDIVSALQLAAALVALVALTIAAGLILNSAPAQAAFDPDPPDPAVPAHIADLCSPVTPGDDSSQQVAGLCTAMTHMLDDVTDKLGPVPADLDAANAKLQTQSERMADLVAGVATVHEDLGTVRSAIQAMASSSAPASTETVSLDEEDRALATGNAGETVSVLWTLIGALAALPLALGLLWEVLRA